MPAHTPAPIVDRMPKAVLADLTTADEKAYFAANTIDLAPEGPQVLRAFVGQEIAKWRGLVKSSGAKID